MREPTRQALKTTSRTIMVSTFMLIPYLVACGPTSVSTRKNDKATVEETKKSKDASTLTCGQSTHDSNVGVVRLKNSELITKSLIHAFGANSSKNVLDANENIVSKYANQLGTTRDLNFGDTYADQFSNAVPATGYLLALNVIGRNVATYCGINADESLCACDTPETAAAMLNRAISFRNFCPTENDEYVKDLVALCKKDQQAAITAIVSSLSFAIRN